jgi:Ca-activated chloride channel family protein
MKKFAVVFIWLGLLGISVAAQTQRASRPRVVSTPTPQTNIPSEPSVKRPPVLIGDTKSNNQTQTDNAPEQIGEDDGEVIKVETNLVTMPVSVLDRDGRFVSGLRQQDFHIFENNMEQKIEYFASVEQPFTVVLMIDVSPSTQFQIEEIQNAAIAFVNQLRRDDKVTVIAFDERVRVLSPPTNNRSVLRNAILQAQFGQGTSLYDAVDDVINRQLRQIEGRKAVVLFTDGVNTTSRRATYQSTVKETEEIDALFYPIRYDTYTDMQSRNGGSNYPQGDNIGIGGIIGIILGGGNVQIGGNQRTGAGSSRAEYETGRRYLEDLARNSGGRTFEANNNLDAAFSGIAEELRRQYTIGYYPEVAGQKGERRQIRVRIQRPNLVVRAKNSYIVGGNDKKVAGH